jgi:hypothetical protein
MNRSDKTNLKQCAIPFACAINSAIRSSRSEVTGDIAAWISPVEVSESGFMRAAQIRKDEETFGPAAKNLVVAVMEIRSKRLKTVQPEFPGIKFVRNRSKTRRQDTRERHFESAG